MSCSSMIEAKLTFGRSKPDGSCISDVEWNSFRDHHIVPRFSRGFTTLGGGCWTKEDGEEETIQEGAVLVIIVYHDSMEARRSIDCIKASYKDLFEQDAVLVTRAPIEAEF